MKFVISSGHGKYVRGASGYIDEVDEARRVVDQTAEEIRKFGHEATVYHDDVSQSQNENLNRIVDFHNSKSRDLDISVHFNAYETTSKAMGTECLYVTQDELAQQVSAAIADAAGFIDRGPKERTDLFFLNNTAEPAILIEVCFVDSSVDVELYEQNLQDICKAIADTVVGEAKEPEELPPAIPASVRDEIAEIAMHSAVASYEWQDRGLAPPGYIQGMALTFATCLWKYAYTSSSVMDEITMPNSGDEDNDVLAWYAPEFEKLEMDNSEFGIPVLRHMFAFMLGLGMRESSGRHCEGRDMSADNVSSDTAEAGLFQTSWNINTCSAEVQKIFDAFKPALSDEMPQCYLEYFERGVTCDSGDWASYGSGPGREYQDLSKECPPAHVEITAVGLRNRRQHWGPVNRKEVELLPEADEMFLEVQELILGMAERNET